MSKPRRHVVSAALLKLAAERADAIMKAKPGLEMMWLDHNRTSTLSNREGGILQLECDSDWILAFYIWLSGHGCILPRER